MVHPSADELGRLAQVAREIRDTTDESGFTVDMAIGLHDAFSSSRGPASSLERSLVLDAARRSAAAAGFSIEEVSGGLDIVAMSGDVIRRYRVKRVKYTAAGAYEVICGKGSSLLMADPESLFREERWILGYLLSDDHTFRRAIAAEVVGWSGTGPVRLTLGSVVDLSDNQPPRGFTSTNEELDGFWEEDDGTDTAGAA